MRKTWVPSLGSALLLTMALGSAFAASRTYTTNSDFEEGVLLGVTNSIVPDQLQLSTTAVVLRFGWISNSGEGSVSKIDPMSGKELARYYTGPTSLTQSPSRTAVDDAGNCWVANRAFGGQASVVQILADGGIDRNGNATIETSSDLNNNGIIDPGEILPWGQDEAVARFYLVGNADGVARAITLDRPGFLWVGLFNERRIIKLDPELSTTAYAPTANARPPELVSIPIDATPYGLALARNNRLYFASLSPTVGEVDPGAASGGTDPPRLLQTRNSGGTSYGVAVDRNNIVWYGDVGTNRCIRWDPTLGAAGFSYGGGAASRGRGITVGFDGKVWMACDLANGVARYSPTNPPTLDFNVPAGGAGFPVGVGVTADSHVVAVGQGSNSWGKINHNTGAAIITGGPQRVGSAPYTYSDFTGSIRYVLTRFGTWTVSFDGGRPNEEWGRISWHDLVPDSTSITAQVRAADDLPGLLAASFQPVANGVRFTGLFGRYIQVEVTFGSERSDLQSPILYDLTIESVNQDPDCSLAAALPAQIWPPNHQLVPVVIAGVTDPDGDPVTITVTGVTQDEPLNERGDGNTCPDAVIVDGAAQVRAERSGRGNGRVYSIYFTASDGRGGSCNGSVVVCVPHDRRGAGACVDDGQIYNSLGGCVNVMRPTSGEVVAADADYEIQWSLPSDLAVDRVNVMLSTDAGKTWSNLMSNLGAPTNLLWHAPATPSSRAHLRVHAYRGDEFVGGGMSPAFEIRQGVLGVGDGPSLLKTVYLLPPRPMPFRGSAVIEYGLAELTHVVIQVFDVNGRHVKTLVDGIEAPGRRSVVWTGATDEGSPSGAGVYVVRLEAGGIVRAQRAVLLR